MQVLEVLEVLQALHHLAWCDLYRAVFYKLRHAHVNLHLRAQVIQVPEVRLMERVSSDGRGGANAASGP